ncbi:MAG: tRNA (guanosine(37)-N1)-methyltransferase TrmD [Clostridia bacterium]|nr:tRNA (guanosine(37)-N1)-methyltransferase TrmD [Clostridia bacterium]
MRIDILTLFPEMFAPLKESVIGRAVDGGKAEIVITDIRDYTLDKHKKCDDTPFGGGAGMVMTAQPIASAIEAVDPEHKARRIYLSPKGRKFCQAVVKEYAALDRILLLCGHYEGVDQRVIDLFIDEELSIGDYVLTGGEIPAMAVTDAVMRYVDGVINGDSLLQESFADGMLEYPHYTKPREFMGLAVPEVLISGNHEKIDEWRKEQSEKITAKNRPDLLKGDKR